MSGNGFKRDMGPGAVTFRDRVDTMTRWFREWSPCEQTIAVYSLIYQLSPSHVRFLSTVMDAYLQEHSEEVKQLEGEANDPGECPHTLRPPCTHTDATPVPPPRIQLLSTLCTAPTRNKRWRISSRASRY